MNIVFKHLIHVARNSGMEYALIGEEHIFSLAVAGEEMSLVVDPEEAEEDGIDVASLKLKSFIYASIMKCAKNWRSHVVLEVKRIGSIKEASIERGFVDPSVLKPGAVRMN